jgi:hypothetical protein
MAFHLFEYSSFDTENGLLLEPLPMLSSINAVLFKVNSCDSFEPTGLTVPFSTHFNATFRRLGCITFGTELELMC